MTVDTAKSLARVITGAVIVALVGLWEGHPFVFLSLYGIGLALWQVWEQERFARWVLHPGDNNLTGRWSQMAKLLTQRYESQRDRARRIVRWLNQYRDAAGSFPDGIVLTDGDGRMLWANMAAVDFLGLSPDVDDGRPIGNLIRNPDFVECFEQAESGSRLVIESPLNSSKSLSLQLIDISDERRMVVVKDVTEYQISETARHDFVANASHELRSPLTVIRGYLDSLAADEKLDDIWHGPVREMLHQSQRMSDLLRDLMDLSRLDRLHLQADLRPIDMAALINEVVNDSPDVAAHKRDLQIEADAGFQLLGERSEIKTVISNLVANAIRYSGNDRRVGISWYIDAQGGHLAVSDNGIGVPEEDIPRLTERFYRVDKGRSRSAGGTGLGLAIVRNTLSRHDGHLEIQSAPGQGSVFICHFPVSRMMSATDNVLAAV